MLSQKNSRKINVLSFMLFIGVMMIHTYNLGVYGIEASDGIIAVFETVTNKFLNGICVPYFFVISGFLFFRNFNMSLLLTKYKNRCCSIVIPYLVWNTIHYLFFVCITRVPFVPGLINGTESWGVELSIKSYVTYLWKGYYTFWFLRVLIWMIVCTPLLWLCLKRRRYYHPEIILILLFALEIKGIYAHGMNIYYTLGAYLGINWLDMINKSNRRTTIIGAGCFIIVLAFGGIFSGNLLYNCSFIFTSWLALDLFHFSKELQWWTKCTFFYYCAHDIILESVEKIILIMFGVSKIMALADYFVSPILTLTLLIGIAWLLKKYMKTVWGVLNGRRQSTEI